MRFLRSMPALLPALLVVIAACGDDDGRTDGTPMDAGVITDATAPTDAGTTADTGIAQDAGTIETPDSGAVGATGSLAGTVSRTASATPEADGVGPVYIAVFDRDPVTNRDTAVLVGQAIVASADLSDASASVPYTLEGIPPRAEPYFVSAFFDADMNAGTDPATAGPDRGDLVSLMGLGSPQVTVPDAAPVDFDVVLNTALLFDP
ncbi:MAG: hypothetical protein CMN30_05065 [Sandaracinus sp.]|nr:hypothetical protein [Sandaracinus sp.]|tara:strand:- start:5070 stop:5687 length:618 start_codon:yes stop_codon:yes gene_type:complete